MNDIYLTNTCATTSGEITLPHLGTLFFDNYVMPYGILTYVFIDDGTAFFSKFSSMLCHFIGLKNLTTFTVPDSNYRTGQEI